MSTPPAIGICAALETARWAVWDQPAALVPMNYIEHVQRAGGVALLIPPDPALVSRPEAVLDRIDGLLLVGGPDIAAARYGAVAHPRAEAAVDLRDDVELSLVRAAWERKLPLLGICRGLQVINVAAGGTLVQDLPDAGFGQEHRRQTGRFAGNEHPVSLTDGSWIARAEGRTEALAASHHHQAVDRVGARLTVTGRAPDGVVEALEADDGGWLVGVQWHPEPDPDSRIIESLVAAAARRAGDR